MPRRCSPKRSQTAPFPLAQCELTGHRSRFLERAFGASFKLRKSERLGAELAERIVAGGYPEALSRSASHRRAAWYRSYVETLVQRDVQLLSQISSLDALPRLLALAAGQTARLLNITDLASPFQLSRPTIRQYVSLLERVFLIDELPPWHSNRLNRLVKTPKIHVGDTGVAATLLNTDATSLARDRTLLSQLLETFVYQELRKQASWHTTEIRFHHMRDKDGVEVDLVLDRGAHELVGVEIKASSTVTTADFAGLRKLRSVTGSKFAAGVVLYDGEACARFDDKLFAVPLRMLWEKD